MSRKDATDEILDAWEVGKLSAHAAARSIWEINQFAVRTSYWLRRSDSVDGLFYQAILESIPKFHRGFRTAFLTYSLQRLKDLLAQGEGEEARSRKGKGAAEAEVLDGVEPSGTRLDFISHLEARRDSLRGRELRGAELKRRRVLELILEDRTIKQTAKATRQSHEEVRALLAEEWTEWNNLGI